MCFIKSNTLHTVCLKIEPPKLDKPRAQQNLDLLLPDHGVYSNSIPTWDSSKVYHATDGPSEAYKFAREILENLSSGIKENGIQSLRPLPGIITTPSLLLNGKARAKSNALFIFWTQHTMVFKSY
jgi:hypothetical protein